MVKKKGIRFLQDVQEPDVYDTSKPYDVKAESFTKNLLMSKMEQCKTPFDIYKPVPVYKDIAETKITSKLKFEYPRIVLGKKKEQDFSFFILMLLLIFILAVGVCVLSPIIFVFSFTLMFVIAGLYYDDCKQIQQEILIRSKFSINQIKTFETMPKERIVVNQKEIDIFNKLKVLEDFHSDCVYFTGTATLILRTMERLKHETSMTAEQLWFINNSPNYLIELYEAYKLVIHSDFEVKQKTKKSVRDSIASFRDKLDEINEVVNASVVEESKKKIDFVNACLKRV